MDVDNTPKAGPSTMVPVAIGLVGVVLGGAALIFAFSSSSSTTKTNDALVKAVGDAAAKAEAAEKKAADLESRILSLAEINQKIDSRIGQVDTKVTTFYAGVNSEFTKVGAAISEDRAQMQKLAEAFQQASTKPAASAPSGGSASAATSSEPAAKPGSAGVHTIVSGDNFSTLARKFGVSIEAIKAANSGVNPERLQIGQKINIPAPAAAPSTPATPAGN